MKLHAHVVDGSIRMQHLVLVALALVDNHHISAAFDFCQSSGDSRHLFTQILVQREEMVNLRVKWRLTRVAVVALGAMLERFIGIQVIGNGERCIVCIRRIEHVGDVGQTILQDADLSSQWLHAGFVPLKASLLFPEMGRHCCHCACHLMLCHVGALGSELTADNCTLAGNDMFRTHVVDVGLEIETKQNGLTQGARSHSVETQISLVFLRAI